MDIFEIQAEILKAIQSFANPVLDSIAKAVTYLGSQYLMTAIFIYVIWCVDKEKGMWMCWSSCWTCAFSNGIKGIFKVKRPIGYEGIRTLASETATSYSFPSGHSLNSANFMAGFYLNYKEKMSLALTVILPAMVGLSRLYLGCHWPLDVIVGYIIGFTVPFILWGITEKYPDKKHTVRFVSVLILIPFLFIKGDVVDFWKSFGILVGYVLGGYLEEKYVGYTVDISKKKKAVRLIVGAFVIVSAYLIMKYTFPETFAMSALRYGIIGFLGTFVCPYIFVKLKT